MVDVVNEDGSTGITLKCPKYQEATTFACIGTGLSDSFERMPDIQIPIHIVSGENSDINPIELVHMKLARCKYGSLEVMKDVGHLLSLEKPQETADQISGFLNRVFESPAEQEQLKARL
ncbi:hypothetical protein BGX29_008298 [Mortierella sp. GBA35]|nr:hypothetical protein BGX23_009032 [Mortierella sp. AD031]KAF9097076.1 hypothetical protein BGX29_008298 [Mortierella sp. GBA35]KAG0206741.1 hypothetical protein BGX33_007232 [Mortierella sp. NVP41]